MEILQDLAGIFTRWRCWYLLATQDIALRYRRSVIGPFWISLSIGVFVLGVSFVYAILFDSDFKEHLNRVATGYLFWHFLSGVVTDGSHAVTEASTALKSIRLPTSVLAARVAARHAIVLLHNFAAIIPIMIIFGGHHFTLEVLWLIPAMMLYMVYGVLAGVALGPLGARFRDSTEILRVSMHLCFFITPVIWPASKVGRAGALIDYNPFYHLIELGRSPMLGTPPALEHWVSAGIVLAVLFVAATISVNVSRQRLALWI